MAADVSARQGSLREPLGRRLHDGGGRPAGGRRERGGGPALRLPHPQSLGQGRDRSAAGPAGRPGGAGHHQGRPAAVPGPLPGQDAGAGQERPEGELRPAETLGGDRRRGGERERFVDPVR